MAKWKDTVNYMRRLKTGNNPVFILKKCKNNVKKNKSEKKLKKTVFFNFC